MEGKGREKIKSSKSRNKFNKGKERCERTNEKGMRETSHGRERKRGVKKIKQNKVRPRKRQSIRN